MALHGRCLPSADDAFGPIVSGCRDDFDFTLKFEQCFFSLVPSAMMLLAGLLRLRYLRSRRRKLIDAFAFKWTKVATISLLAVLQLTLIILWVTTKTLPARSVGTAASVLSFLATLVVILLSPLEHGRSLRPSSSIGIYFLSTIVFDAAILRTLWLSTGDGHLRDVLTSSLGLKVVILVLETQGKRRHALSSQDQSRSPEEFSGPYSRSLLWWLNDLLRSGFKQVLGPRDLFPNNESLRTEHLSKQFQTMWSESPRGSKHSLLLTVIRVLKVQLVLPVPPRLVLLALAFCQPLLLRRLIDYLQDASQRSDPRIGYGLIGAYFLVYTGIAISSSIYWQSTLKLLTMLRGTLIAAIYQKTTTVDITAQASSKSVTLMGADAERIVRGLRDVHELWANVIQIALATWLLKVELGVACVGPLVVTILSVGATVAAASFTTKRQKAWMGAIEKRIAMTTSMLGSMKTIKMTGIASRISHVVHQLRLDEMQAAKSFWMLGVYTSSVAIVPQMISPVAAFAIFAIDAVRKNETLDISRLFTSLSLLILLTQPLFDLFAGIMEFMSAFGCFDRIQQYLTAESRADSRIKHDVAQPVNSGLRAPGPFVLSLSNGAFGWSPNGDPVVSDLQLCLARGRLMLVAGPVACGKTTLLKGILGEVPSASGDLMIDDVPIAFCDQIPWLTNATIKENIVGYSKFENTIYEAVLTACALQQDLNELSEGDRTRVGSKGIALSSGQKHRIALARAVYSQHKFMLLDDVFSQLDANIKMTIFSNLLGPQGLLRKRGTTVLLATHEVSLLPFADDIVCLGRDGRIQEQGTFEQLRQNGGYVQELLHDNRIDETLALPLVNLEATPSRRSHNTSTALPDLEEQRSENPRSKDKSRQLGDVSTYKSYFSCLGRSLTAIFWILQCCYAFFTVFPVVWLKWWADDNTRSPDPATYARHLAGYAGLQVAGVLSAGTLTWFCFYILAQKAALELHTRLLRAVIRAPMSLFWSTDTGSITTRFSQDFQFIDSTLPLAMMAVVTNLLICVGQAGLIASASAWLVISFPPLLVVFWLVQGCYLRTSRQLRLLDLEEKAPLYTQFIESLEGLTTIRAFRWQEQCVERNHVLVDDSQKPYYLLFMVQKWLALVLDLIVTALAVLVVGVIIGLRDTVSPGFSAVSLTQIISFTGYVKLLIMFWTNMETSLGAVMRIKQFTGDTNDEDAENCNTSCPSDWPTTGEVRLRDLSVVYKGKTDHIALRNVNLHIKQGEKIGICGRTGSGKTTLALSLLKLIDIASGSISIDGVDIASLRSSDVRSRLTVVPDEPFFMPGSLRTNLDPHHLASDAQIREALDSVLLKHLSETEGGLDGALLADDLSHGQKQLFALARVLLHSIKKVVVLDEATSRIDKKSDAAIQKVIRKAFAGATVIVIAHRLENIMDFDRIAVMDQGQVVEFDSPQELLKRPSGIFRVLFERHRHTVETSA